VVHEEQSEKPGVTKHFKSTTPSASFGGANCMNLKIVTAEIIDTNLGGDILTIKNTGEGSSDRC
jgi:hypothetical protein